MILKVDWKQIWGHLRKFSKFCLCQKYLHLKDFAWKWGNILKTTKDTKFIKTILESTYKVVSDTYNLAAPTQPVFLLRAVEF